MRTTDHIAQISEVNIPNFQDTFVIIDSDELNGTYKMRMSQLILALDNAFALFGLSYANGEAVCLSDGSIPRVERGF